MNYYGDEFNYAATQLYLTAETESLIRKRRRIPFDEKIESLRKELDGIIDSTDNIGFQSKYRAWEWLNSAKNMFTGEHLGKNFPEELKAAENLIKYFGEKRNLDDEKTAVFIEWVKTDMIATREANSLTKKEQHIIELAKDVEKENRKISDVLANLSEQSENYETHWSDYKLDGGSNYREVIFTMPNSSYSNRAMRGHWGQDAEGVLAHARIQDFVVNGKKMLFIEEIQSDWHNEGHQSGYSTKEYEDAVESHDKL
jgi:hypothetical protein